MKKTFEFEPLLYPGEVARLFNVSDKTVARWAKEGLFPEGSVVTTLGGHRRFKETVVRGLLEAGAR